MTAVPYSAEELEQVRQYAEGDRIKGAMSDHVKIVRLLATLAENDKAFYAAIAPLHATILNLNAQLTASHNGALERAAAICVRFTSNLDPAIGPVHMTAHDTAAYIADEIRALMRI